MKRKKGESSGVEADLAGDSIIMASFPKKSKSRLTQKKRVITISLAAVLVAAIMGAWYSYSKPALSVGAHKYSQLEIRGLYKDAASIGVGKVEARGLLRESLAARAAADRLGVKYPTDEMSLLLAAQKRAGDSTLESLNKYQTQVAYIEVVNSAVELEQKGGFQFTVLDYSFSRYITGFMNSDFGDYNLIGQKSAVLEDMQYAHTKRDEAVSALDKDLSSLTQLVPRTSSDTRLINGQFRNQSDQLMVDASGKRLGVQEVSSISADLLKDVLEAAKKMHKPVVSEQLFGPPTSSYGLADLSEIQRGDHTLVGWRVVVVHDSRQGREGVEKEHKELVKEYLNV